MTRDEFRRQLDQLLEVITRGLFYYTVLKKLRLREEGRAALSLEDQNKVLGRFRGFFTPVGFALFDMALLQFAKVFDRDARTASLPNLRSAARRDTNLVSGGTSAEMNEVWGRFRQSKKLLTRLEQRRNHYLAHADVNARPVDPPLVSELDCLVETVESAFNSLSRAHDGRIVWWEHPLREVEAHTSQVMEMLLEDLNRQQATLQAIAERTRS